MSSPTLDYLNLKSTDPAFNLAAEQFVFDSLPRDRSYFMLWQNSNAVIIGKYQNTLAEINSSVVESRGIKVVRRLSGGGAVYHDLGNLNFTFITDAGDETQLDLKAFCLPVIDSLGKIGVKAEINGRNDMTIDGKKFSGNSQYLRNGRVMHHGTILFNSDLSAISDILNVDSEKIESKGIKSVRSRVTNISDYLKDEITLENFRTVLLDSILEGRRGEEHVFSTSEISAIDKIRKERYDSWDWNFGKSPECTILKTARIEGCGKVEAYISADHATVQNIEFRGDFFSSTDPSELAKLFVGCRAERDAYKAVLEGVEVSRYFKGITNEQLLAVLAD